jgi:hypothetical protein
MNWGKKAEWRDFKNVYFSQKSSMPRKVWLLKRLRSFKKSHVPGQ